jgi:hypothetical protein
VILAVTEGGFNKVEGQTSKGRKLFRFVSLWAHIFHGLLAKPWLKATSADTAQKSPRRRAPVLTLSAAVRAANAAAESHG